MSFVVEVARKMASDNEQPMVDKMENEMIDNYHAGKCIDIAESFPEIKERKFWAEMFYETAREIFERKIGVKDYFFW